MSYCPLIKEVCKGNECVMWKNEKCTLVAYLYEAIEDETEETPSSESGMRSSKVSSEMKEISAEKLAEDFVTYAKREFPDERSISYILDQASLLVLAEKKYDERDYFNPPEIHLKIEKARILARRQMEKERANKDREQLALEKTKLPQITNDLYDWARANSLNRVTQGEIDAFLIEKENDLSQETRHQLQSIVNLRLKTKKA